LIRTGQAALATEVSHVFEEIAPSLVWRDRAESPESPPGVGDHERCVLAALDDVVVGPDRIARVAGLDRGAVALALARLEVRGLVTRRGAGYELSGGSRVGPVT
jgi:predicted Rossmann fold nucleotide-binding protein DprA/Smf involved in DNA uptake